MQTMQSAMILAVSAMVLLGMRMLWDPKYSGSGGLIAFVEQKFVVIFNGGEDIPKDPSDPNGGGSGSGGSGGDGSGGDGSGDDGSGDDGSGDDGSGGDGSGGDGSGGDPSDNWDAYADVAMSVAIESSKLYGKEIIEKAKTAALREVATNDPLLEAFGMSVKDFDIDATPGREAAFRGAGVVVDALVGVDGLIQGDAKVRELADAGDFPGAWRATWTTPAKFIADTIFASKAVDLVLDRLPGSVQLAIKVGVPKAIEHAAGAAADALFEPVAVRANEKLWDLYDQGLVPRPRNPRK
jgi:hypothetical protein